MGRFRQVTDILDAAVGGRDAAVGVHGPFWRDLTREQFVVRKVVGRPLLVVGDSAASNLVRALKGDAPFGADLENPPAGASFSRMPAGLATVPAESVAFIAQWIDDGCPDDVEPAPRPQWRPTGAPTASSRTDDIWFVDPLEGWAVNSNGQILHTTDGFDTVDEQFHDESLYLRCVGFADSARGWVGTLSPGLRLLSTGDGGATWNPVTDLPALAPAAVCGLSVVDASVVYASGTNFPNRPARMMRTLDGGASWEGWDMGAHATLLVDTYFTDPDHGWVVGGRADVPDPTRSDVRAVVLRTEDGGHTWVDRAAALSLPLGEWGWKIHFIDERVGYVALESFERAAVLKTIDGGDSWTRIDVTDPQGNVNLEGVGFLDESTGWVGGWGVAFVGDPDAGFSSATTDGGKTWQDANDVGRFLNRFRFFRGADPSGPLGYASGLTVYRYSAEPPATVRAAGPSTRLLVDNAPRRATAPVELALIVPAGTARLTIDVWDRFGEKVRRVLVEDGPSAGARTVTWDATGDDGRPAQPGSVIVRVTADGRSESQIMHVTG